MIEGVYVFKWHMQVKWITFEKFFWNLSSEEFNTESTCFQVPPVKEFLFWLPFNNVFRFLFPANLYSIMFLMTM
jgi:hypothetical protein